MITEQDLREAIAECEGERNPTSTTCMKLAAFYTIRDKMYPQTAPLNNESLPSANVSHGYSYAAEPKASYDSETEFMQAVREQPMNRTLAVLDEIMTTLSVINPRLYAAAMRKLLDN